ncbi:MAG: methyltransferase domain-containing protein [Acetobacter sp.]|nr:methyltransferase domain-containing protein [Bacteroides sp.]MCM1341966.1 methyltransferase domain-containing protein [Acetobacter sp.]MCM1434151.1 methyltransferase domain-containing protein [Clostridiales bacterium]
MSVLICPVCREKLNKSGNTCKCANNHSFDFAKEGYVNLLTGSKNGDKSGDSKESARARHEFLAKGYYSCLKNHLVQKFNGTVLDICCGEGYYDSFDGELYGFDISKEMVRLASKSNKNGKYFVANLANIPVKSESIDTAIHLFAPFNEKEFARILKSDGILYSVIPGENHLYEMKQVVYDKPYKNDEKAPETEILTLKSKTKISEKVSINGDDLKTLFSMTPYFYRTSDENKARLNSVDKLDLTVEFVVLEYRRKESNG